MDTREDLPKVSIETEQDWRRIQHNLSDALLARLEAQLESRGQTGDKDKDKDALLPYVHQFLEDLFDIARPNLRVNGRTTEGPCSDEDDVEPFDEALDRHIWSLSDQRLKWDKEIADRRRSRPQEIEKLVMESLGRHHLGNLEASDGSDAYSDVELKQVDCESQQTLSNVASVVPYLLQTVKLQRSRADSVTYVSTEVKAPRP